MRYLPDLHDRALRIDDAEPDHSVYPDWHIIAGDALLFLDITRDRAKIQLDLPFDQRPHQVQAGPGGAIELAEAKDNTALVLVGDPDALRHHRDGDDNAC